MERIVELTPGALRSYGGNYDDYRRQRDTEQQAARADLEHAREERRRTRARQQKEHDMSQRRSAQTLRVVDTLNIASFERVAYKSAAKESLGTLRKQHQDQRASLDAAVREAYQRVEDEQPVLLALPGSEVSANKQVLVLEQLQLPFVSAPPLDLRIDGPMRVALTGPNGCGKSTLLKTVLGQLTALSGHCHCPLSTAYLDQTLSQLDPSLSVMDHLGLQDSPLAEGALRTRLAQLQLGADRIALPLGSLSGGERLKAALACALWRRQPAQLLLLDEPTNHGSGVVAGDRNCPGGFPRRDAGGIARRRLPAGAAADAPPEPAGGRLAASGLVTRKGGPRGRLFISGALMHASSWVKAAAICSSGTQANPISRPRRRLGSM